MSLVGAAVGILAPAAEAAPYACTDKVSSSCPGLVCVGTTTSVPKCVRDPCEVANCVTLQRLYCIEGQPNCPAGELVCALPDSVRVCVPDPCYTTACFAAQAPPVGGCNDVTSECDGNLVCVWISQQVPQCVRDPCPDQNCVSPPPCACAPFDADPSFGPLVGVCIKGQTAPDCYDGHDVCVQFSYQVPFCADIPGVIYSPRVCLQGVRDCPSGDWACVGSICIMQPCQYCVPLQADPTCLVVVEENTQLAGVTYHDCYHVDGYVCTDPEWYGGHGIWGWVCEETTPFSLP